jgi:hypothetical protein
VLLYPGEVYNTGLPHDTNGSIEKYNVDFEKIGRQENLVRVIPVSETELVQQASKFVGDMKKKFGMWTGLLKPCNVFITDYKKSFSLSMDRGLIECDLIEGKCDCSLSSESLAYNFKFPWGNDSLGINGRYQRPPGGNYSRFYNFFRYNQLESRGIQINLGFFADMALRKVLVKAGLKKI